MYFPGLVWKSEVRYPDGIILLEEGDEVKRSGTGLDLAETEAMLDPRLWLVELFL